MLLKSGIFSHISRNQPNKVKLSMTTFHTFLPLLLPLSLSLSSPPPKNLSPTEWMAGIMTPIGSPSTQDMECLASDNPLDTASEFIQVLVKRTWSRNKVPYVLDDSLLPMDRLVIAKAMHIIQSTTCVRQVCTLQGDHPPTVGYSIKKL